jgi:hypothetical protein
LLPSSPYCPPGQSLVAVSYQHLRESQALHLDYYKRKEKKIFHIKEMCMRCPRTRPRRCAFPLLPEWIRERPRKQRHHAKSIFKLQKCPSNGHFCGG